MKTKIALTDYDDLGLVDCAECGRELVGERSQEKYDLSHGQYLFVFTRIGGRPYCRPCSRRLESQTVLEGDHSHDSERRYYGNGASNIESSVPVVESYPGGKSRVADLVWSRLGNVDNFVEPFCGTMAVLLRRPAEHFANGYRVETVNDANQFIVNFWRAVTADPVKVAEYADWPVMEADLHARHLWLMRSETAAEFREKIQTDPNHHDAKIAGWWVHGQCCWIGSGWCADLNGSTDWKQTPEMAVDRGVHGRPQLADAFDIGRGVNGGGNLSRPAMWNNGGGGWGLHAFGPPNAGTCSARRAWLVDWLTRLSDRLRLVRVCYGHWSRICDSDSTLTRLGTTGVFLDPPYPARRGDNGEKSRDDSLYANDKTQDLDALRDEVLAWCRKWGGNPLIRIAVCGYEGDGYEALESEGWSVESWEASGGYGNQNKKKKGKAENAKRERIWFNPQCIEERSLFDGIEL